MKWRELVLLVVLSAIWGVSFLLIGVAAPALGPVGLVNVRMLIAGSLLLIYARLTGQADVNWRHTWKTFVLLGVLNSALPLMLEAIAVVQLNASIVAILSTMTPLVTALVAALWLRERLTVGKVGGLVLGLLGVVLLVGWSPLPLTGETMLSIIAVLAASTLYAIASVYAKTRMENIAPLALTMGQELAAGMLLLPWTVSVVRPSGITPEVIGSTLILAVIMTAGGNLMYYRLLASVGPTKAQSVSFLVPVFALLAGVALFDEPVTASMVLGLTVILVSVFLVLDIPARPMVSVHHVLHRAVPRMKRVARGSGYGPIGSLQRLVGHRAHVLHAHGAHHPIPARVLYDRHSQPILVQHSVPA